MFALNSYFIPHFVLIRKQSVAAKLLRVTDTKRDAMSLETTQPPQPILPPSSNNPKRRTGQHYNAAPTPRLRFYEPPSPNAALRTKVGCAQGTDGWRAA